MRIHGSKQHKVSYKFSINCSSKYPLPYSLWHRINSYNYNNKYNI